MTEGQTDAVKVARDVLLDLEERLASKNHQEIVDAYTADAVLIADDNEYYTHDTISTYLEECAVMEPTIRWTWNEVAATQYAPSVVGFAAAATMSFYSPSGELLADPESFRMSCVVTETDGRWKISQYHGSRPVE
jgi:ketosteroid isomerase-like protein